MQVLTVVVMAQNVVVNFCWVDRGCDSKKTKTKKKEPV